jgi:hypothetical protein
METFLLDKKFKYSLDIINQVNQTASREISIAELAKNLGITKRTTKSYLDTLLTYCEQNNLETFTIQESKLQMALKTSFNIFDLYHYFSQQSVKYQILTAIFENSHITFTDLYLNLALSKSNLSLHIKQLNQFLKPYHCNISFIPEQPLQGDEHQIRFLHYNLLWGLNLDEIIPHSQSLEQVMQLLLEVSPDLPSITLSKIKLEFYIYQVASKSNRFIASEVDFRLPDSPFITYQDFFQKIDALNFLKDCPDLQTKQREARYLYFIFCRAYLLTLEECKHYEDKITYSNSPNVQYFIREFQEKSGITLAPFEVKFLGYNLTLFNCEAAIYKGRTKTFELEKLVDTFIENGGNVPKFIGNFIDHICHNLPEIKTFLQKFPSLQHYYVMLLRILLVKHQQPLKLLVQSSISSLHRQEMINQIVNSTSFPIEVYTSEQLNGSMPDGIISNWIPEEKHRDVPFFSTALFHTSWHKGDLDRFLRRLEASKSNDR